MNFSNPDFLAVVVSFVLAYLIGGVPFGYLVARARGVDIRKVGSGNIGATNVGRALGRPWGFAVLGLDVAKGFLPVLFLAPWIAGRTGSAAIVAAMTATGLGAILGHVFTPYLGLKGGKGVATSAGVFAALTGFWILLPLGAYVVLRKATGFVSAGSLALAALLPVAAYLRHREDVSGGLPVIVLAGVAGLLLVLRHSANIVRLVRGTEHAVKGKDQA